MKKGEKSGVREVSLVENTYVTSAYLRSKGKAQQLTCKTNAVELGNTVKKWSKLIKCKKRSSDILRTCARTLQRRAKQQLTVH
jgi:hypothetical protein